VVPGFRLSAAPNTEYFLKKMKNRIIFFGILLTITTFYVGGCRRAGNWLVKEDMPAHADAMVLLMGSLAPDRVLQTTDLYHEGRAGRLIIVTESMGPYRTLEARGADIINTTEQVHDACIALGIPEDSITVLAGDACSTLDEATIVSDYLGQCTTFDTLLLVSSSAHMRRASMIFRAAFRDSGTPVYIGCSPSRYSSFRSESWWRRKEDIQVVLPEYVKILNFIVVEKRQIRKARSADFNKDPIIQR
jgi:uncharacterized SAM-binding protein YcdF (DUF218 family)